MPDLRSISRLPSKPPRFLHFQFTRLLSDSSSAKPTIRTMPNHKHLERNKNDKVLDIAFLICDEPAESTLKEHGGFDDLLNHLIEPILKEADEDIKLDVKGYDVVYKREYPTIEDLNKVDCVIISGSFVEDACVDTAWIARLAGYVVYLHDEWPSIRIIGICFGHQIISRAFGSRIEKNDKGWEIGSTELTLTEEGQKLLGTPGSNESTLKIQQIHSDHVTSVPEGFHLLASSKKCKVQSLVKYYKGVVPEFTHGAKLPPAPYSQVHILTTQGHPEWDGKHVIIPLVEEFLKDGKIDKELAEEAKENAKRSDDSVILGRALLRVMGVAYQSTHDLAAQKKP